MSLLYTPLTEVPLGRKAKISQILCERDINAVCSIWEWRKTLMLCRFSEVLAADLQRTLCAEV